MDRIWAANQLGRIARSLRDSRADADDVALAGILDDVRTAILAERVPDLAAAVTAWATGVAEQLERENGTAD